MDYRKFFYDEMPVLLRDLKTDTPALWGKMNAQQMVEHLAMVVSFSNGRFVQTPTAEPDRLAYRKMRFFEKDAPMPRNLRVDGQSEEPKPPIFTTLEESKIYLLNQLQRFDDYHAEHPDVQPPHFMMGAFNYAEWVVFHARHFRHHFQQFGLLPLPEVA